MNLDELPVRRSPGMPHDEWATIIAIRSARYHTCPNFKNYVMWLDYYLNLVFSKA